MATDSTPRPRRRTLDDQILTVGWIVLTIGLGGFGLLVFLAGRLAAGMVGGDATLPVVGGIVFMALAVLTARQAFRTWRGTPPSAVVPSTDDVEPEESRY